MWRTRNKNVSPKVRHGRAAALTMMETREVLVVRRAQALWGRPCRWSHLLLVNAPEGKKHRYVPNVCMIGAKPT